MATETLIAIDPGQATGYALFSGARLVLCGTFACLVDVIPSSVRHHARYAQVVCEMPVDRKADRVNPDDIITLAYRLGLVIGDLRSLGCLWPVRTVTPVRWKGQTPKDVVHNRIRDLVSSPERNVTRGADHNALDAVGIGLWSLGRYGLG